MGDGDPKYSSLGQEARIQRDEARYARNQLAKCVLLFALVLVFALVY